MSYSACGRVRRSLFNCLLVSLFPGVLFGVFTGGPAEAQEPRQETAIFAGGCFWCMEPPFEKLDGVNSVISGYTGGTEIRPSYAQVSAGRTGHAEAVQIKYDPGKISYERLLEVFWRNIDPLAVDRQFCDKGKQYRSAIFYDGEEQEKAAKQAKAEIAQKLGSTVATQVVEAGDFYPAEEYHQDYYRKNPAHYQRYRLGCKRDERLKELWGNSIMLLH